MVEKESQGKRNGVKDGGRKIKGVGGCSSGTVSSMLLCCFLIRVLRLESLHSNSQIRESRLSLLFFAQTPQGGTCLLVFGRVFDKCIFLFSEPANTSLCLKPVMCEHDNKDVDKEPAVKHAH